MLAPDVETAAPNLRAQGLSYREIARKLDIDAIHARDLCRRHERQLRAAAPVTRVVRRPRSKRGLSARAMKVLLHGTHADAGGRSVDERMGNLGQIAAAYRRTELLAEPRIGRITVDEIEAWLALRGLGFRAPLWA